MEKARSENEKLDLEFSVSGVSTQNYLSFIQFLDASNKDDEVVTSLIKLTSLKKENLSAIEKDTARTLALLFNKHGCRLATNKPGSEDALKLFEFGQLLLDSQGNSLDPECQNLKNSLQSNIAAYNFINKDNVQSSKLTASLLLDNNKLKSETKALLYQNLAVISARQGIYERAIKYSKWALMILESEVYAQIKSCNDHAILRQDKTFKQKLLITLNGYLTMALAIKRIKHDPSQEQQFLQHYGPALGNKPFLQNGQKLARSFLGKSHPLSLLFQKEIDKGNQVEKPNATRVEEHNASRVDERSVTRLDAPKPNKAGRTSAESSIPRNRPAWLQQNETIKRNYSNPRLTRPKTEKVDVSTISLKSRKNESKIKDRLAMLLNNERKTASSSKGSDRNSSYSASKSSALSMSSSSNSRDFRIKRDSSSGLQPLKNSIFMRRGEEEDTEEAPSQSETSAVTYPTESEDGKGSKSHQRKFSRERKSSASKFRRHASKSRREVHQEAQIDELAQSQLQIAKNLESIMKQQIEFEEKITKKIEETLWQTQKFVNSNENLAQKELELKIELLKKDNEKIQQTKLEKEYELEQLRLQLNSNNNIAPKNLNTSIHPQVLNSSGLLPYFNSQLGGPLSPIPIFTGHSPISQALATSNSQLQSLDLRALENAGSSVISSPNQRVPQLQVPNPRKFRHQSSIEMNMAENAEPDQNQHQNAEPEQNKNQKEGLPLIIIEPPHSQDDEKDLAVSPDFRAAHKKAEDQRLPEIRIIGTNSAADLGEQQRSDPSLEQPGCIKADEPEKVNSTCLTGSGESKANLSGVNSSKNPSNRSGKYSDPKDRVFQLDFSKIGKKPGEQEEKTKPSEEKSSAIKEPKVQLERKASIPLSKPANSVTPKSENSLPASSIVITQQQEPETQNKPRNSALQIPSQNEFSTSSLYQISKSYVQVDDPGRSQMQETVFPSITEINPSRSKIDYTNRKVEPVEVPIKVESIPTPKQEEPKLIWLLETPDYIKFPKKASIKKHITLLEDPNTYQIECVMEYQGTELGLKVELKQKALTCDDYYALSEESLKLGKLNKILQSVEYKDVLPSFMTIGSIKTFESFVKYLIFPFFGLTEDEEGYKKLEIWPRAPSIARTMPEIKFLNQVCLLSIHHVSMTEFRITLMHSETEETFRIDFSLDDSSFGRYFECIKPAKAAPNQVDDLLSFMDIVEDDESTSEELQQAANLVKQAQNQNNFETEFEYYKFISKEEEKAVLEYAKKTLTEIEAFLKEKNLTDFSKLCETTTQFKYFKLRVFNEFKRSNFSMLLENLEANCIDVYLKNLFETHAPHKKKIKAEGRCQYPLDSIWKDFALNYNRMDRDNKTAVYSLISELSSLETHDKPLDPEDYETFEENPIIQHPIETSIFSRILKGHKYKYPITSVLVGVRGTPFGIRTSLFDVEKCTEKGVFFFFNPQLWKRKEDFSQFKKKKKWTVISPMIEKYHFDGVLQRGGYNIINRQLILDERSHKIELKGVESLKCIARSDLLENIVNTESFVKYYKETKGSDLFDI